MDIKAIILILASMGLMIGASFYVEADSRQSASVTFQDQAARISNDQILREVTIYYLIDYAGSDRGEAFERLERLPSWYLDKLNILEVNRQEDPELVRRLKVDYRVSEWEKDLAPIFFVGREYFTDFEPEDLKRKIEYCLIKGCAHLLE